MLDEMMQQTNDTVTDDADAIMHLFWRKGYAATSLEDISSASSLARADIYKRFGSKEKLFLLTLKHYYQQVFESMIALPLKKRGGGIAAIKDFFEGFRTKYRAGEATNGCLLINALVELGEGGSFARDITNAFLSELRYLMVSRVNEEAKDQAQKDRAQVLADALVANVFGLLTLCRGHAPSQAVENFFEQIFIWLDLPQTVTASAE